MRKTRFLIILVAVLVVVVGGFSFFRLWQAFQTPATEPTIGQSLAQEHFVQFEVADIDLLSIRNKNGTLTLFPVWEEITPTPLASNSDNNVSIPAATSANIPVLSWGLRNIDSDQVSRQAVTNLGNELLSIHVSDVLGVKTTEELTEYGIDPAENPTITYSLLNGDEVVLVLGDPVPSNEEDQYYLLNNATGEVAVLDQASAYFDQSVEDLLNKTIFPFETSAIESFVLQRQDDEFLLEGEKHTDVRTGNPYWQMSSPEQWRGNMSNISNLLTEFLQVQADEFLLATDAMIQETGLQTPLYKIILRTADESIAFFVADSGSAEQTYGMIEGQEYLFTFNRSILTQTSLPTLDFYDRFAALVNITDVKELQLKIGNDLYISEIFHPTTAEIEMAQNNAEDSPVASYTLNGYLANVTNESNDNLFTRYYQSVIGITFAGFDSGPQRLADSPDYEVIYDMRTNEQDIHLAFVHRTTETLYFYKNGIYTGFYISAGEFTNTDNRDEPGILLALEQLQEKVEENDQAVETTSNTTSDFQTEENSD